MGKSHDLATLKDDGGTFSGSLNVTGSNFASTTYTGTSVNPTGVYTGLTSDGGFTNNVRDSGYLQLSTNNVERMRIDPSGRVTMPYQPFFYAQAGASRNSVSGILTYNDVIHNVGSHYDGTNKFTAPIAGVYLFKGQAYKEGSNGTLRLRVNGSNVEEDGRQIGGTTTHSSLLTIAIYKLSASDFVQLYADYNSHQNPTYSVFSGMLIG